MPAPLNQTLTHGSYDAQAVERLLAEGDFCEALCASMQLLSTCFLASPRSEEFAQAHQLLTSIDIAHDWPFGDAETLTAVAELMKQGASESEDELTADYTRLFRGPNKLPAPSWGSVYQDRDQVMYGWTWVELRTWLRTHGIEGSYEENDPEDNFGRMLSLAATVATQRPALLAELLADHLLCWSDRFLELLEPAARTASYRGFALLARTTLLDIQDILGIEPAKRKLYR